MVPCRLQLKPRRTRYILHPTLLVGTSFSDNVSGFQVAKATGKACKAATGR